MKKLLADIPVIGLLVAVTKDPCGVEIMCCWGSPAPGQGLIMPTGGTRAAQEIQIPTFGDDEQLSGWIENPTGVLMAGKYWRF